MITADKNQWRRRPSRMLADRQTVAKGSGFMTSLSIRVSTEL